jgi:hypothetical protein
MNPSVSASVVKRCDSSTFQMEGPGSIRSFGLSKPATLVKAAPTAAAIATISVIA